MATSDGGGWGAVVWGVFGLVLASGFFVAFRQRQMVTSSNRIMRDLGPQARKAMLGFIGAEPKYLDARGVVTRDWNPPKATGSGIAVHGGNLYIMDDGEIAKVPWSLVREWVWKVEGYSSPSVRIAGAPPGQAARAQMRTNATTMNASAAAKRDSELFLTVADVEKPQWQFRTDDGGVLRKWNEILTQMMEGRLAVE